MTHSVYLQYLLSRKQTTILSFFVPSFWRRNIFLFLKVRIHFSCFLLCCCKDIFLKWTFDLFSERNSSRWVWYTEPPGPVAVKQTKVMVLCVLQWCAHLVKMLFNHSHIEELTAKANHAELPPEQQIIRNSSFMKRFKLVFLHGTWLEAHGNYFFYTMLLHFSPADLRNDTKMCKTICALVCWKHVFVFLFESCTKLGNPYTKAIMFTQLMKNVHQCTTTTTHVQKAHLLI